MQCLEMVEEQLQQPLAVLDAAALDRLRALDGSGSGGVLRRVLEAYRGSLGRYLGDIAAAERGGDLQALVRAAHTLKSSSAAIGAFAFSTTCAEVELIVRRDACLPPPQTFTLLALQGAEVQSAVDALLAV